MLNTEKKKKEIEEKKEEKKGLQNIRAVAYQDLSNDLVELLEMGNDVDEFCGGNVCFLFLFLFCFLFFLSSFFAKEKERGE